MWMHIHYKIINQKAAQHEFPLVNIYLIFKFDSHSIDIFCDNIFLIFWPKTIFSLISKPSMVLTTTRRRTFWTRESFSRSDLHTTAAATMKVVRKIIKFWSFLFQTHCLLSQNLSNTAKLSARLSAELSDRHFEELSERLSARLTGRYFEIMEYRIISNLDYQ